MRKLLTSLLTIAAVVGIGFLATNAFFSDTETSTGNIFQAGAIDLTVDSQAHYNGMVCTDMGEEGIPRYQWQPEANFVNGVNQYPVAGTECHGTWALTDLGPTNKFFSYSDLKPGDYGENTISLHVHDNDAYMCAMIHYMVDYENGCTEPESEAGDTTCNDPGPGEGELSQELRFFAWADNGVENPGNNIWEEGEPILFSNIEGPASDVINGVVYPMYTPQTEVFPGGETRYIGLYWCYGNLIVNQGDYTLDCDGVGGTNLTQTDGLTADISFYVEQARNNEGFTCPTLEQVACEYNVQPTGVSYTGLYGSTVTPVNVTNENCSQVAALQIEATQSFSQGQPEGVSAGWAGWSCLEAGFPNAIGGGIIPSGASVIDQGLAESGAPAVSGYNYPTYPHHVFPANEEGWVVEAAGPTPPTSIYVLCAQ